MKRFVLIIGFLTIVRCQGPLNAPFAPAFNSNPLSSEGYSEGSCIAPDVDTTLDPNWLITQRIFYIPIASQFAHRRYAETLLSRSPNSESELQTMCLTLELSSNGGGLNVTNNGFDDREFRQSCQAPSPGRFTCFATGSSGGVNPTRTGITEDYVVSVDNRNYMLVVRCVDGYFRDYKLLTTRPAVSLELYNRVLNITRNLGFDNRRLQIMSYENCLNNVEINTLTPAINIQRRRAIPFGVSPYTAPFAPNLLGLGLPQNSGAFGLGQNFGTFGLGQNQGGPVGISPVNGPVPGLSPFGNVGAFQSQQPQFK